MPVFAYICRYSFEISTNASRALIDLTHARRSQTSAGCRSGPTRPVSAARISSADIVGCGVYTLGRLAEGSASAGVMGTPSTRRVAVAGSFSHFSKSTVPGNGVSITNCAKVTPACCASAAVASKVSRPVARQSEDERAEHVDAVLRKRRSRSTSSSPES